jgi:GTP-binding protein
MIVLKADFEKSAPNVSLAPPGDLPEFCFVGRSNVGKSSALNTLTNRRQLARVSKTPGRTRLLNFFRIELADKAGPKRRTAALRFCDLPGYGYAEAPKEERKTWGAMMEAYLKERDCLAAVVVLVDAVIGPQPKDYEMMSFLAGSTRPLIVVATKADRLARTRRGAALDKVARDLGVPRGSVLGYSSDENIGRNELWQTLCAAAGVFGRSESEHILEPEPPSGEP